MQIPDYKNSVDSDENDIVDKRFVDAAHHFAVVKSSIINLCSSQSKYSKHTHRLSMTPELELGKKFNVDFDDIMT
ncbi:MAG: hypothetical protein M3M89_05270 [Thermoproteota archaeon]|nr:hypothetical protein [Thermoproteota archaeon]